MSTTILDAREMRAAISDRILRYDDGAEQRFHADGSTEYRVGDEVQPGRWEIEGDDYVSLWPPSSHRDLYQVQATGDGSGAITGLTFIHRRSGDRFSGHFISHW